MIVIVDYGVGNIKNVMNAFERLGVETILSSDPEQIEGAAGVVLPGVGAFQDAMRKLQAKRLDWALKRRAAANRPTLGVCLGMQLLFQSSSEGSLTTGLGLLEGTVEKIPYSTVKIPHIGWNVLRIQQEDPITDKLPSGPYVYFVHSFMVSSYLEKDLIMDTCYGGAIPAILRRGNTIGMQFHPEKSGKIGEQLLRNFIQLVQEDTRNDKTNT